MPARAGSAVALARLAPHGHTPRPRRARRARATRMAASDDRPIRAQGLAKRFGDVQAVAGLDLAAERGTCLGLLGPNGAGKTTTIEILEGLADADAGSVAILGMGWSTHARAIRERIGVQLQSSELPEKLRVHEALRLFRGLYARGGEPPRDVERMLETVGLTEKRGAFLGELSGGQRQRLSLACALVHEPEVLFLDEPTTGLDPQGRRKLWEIVEGFKAAGGTVLLTTHFMEEAERLADRLLIIDRGREIASGTPRAIVSSLGSDSILELALAGPGGSAAPEERLAALEARLAGLEQARSVRREGARVKVGAARFERVLPAVLALCAELGLEVADLGVHRPTLEDVFVSLTGRGLR